MRGIPCCQQQISTKSSQRLEDKRVDEIGVTLACTQYPFRIEAYGSPSGRFCASCLTLSFNFKDNLGL